MGVLLPLPLEALPSRDLGSERRSMKIVGSALRFRIPPEIVDVEREEALREIWKWRGSIGLVGWEVEVVGVPGTVEDGVSNGDGVCCDSRISGVSDRETGADVLVPAL